MVNYRVENLVELVADLRKNDVHILDDIEEFEYGKFVHIMDPEGNKIELWDKEAYHNYIKANAAGFSDLAATVAGADFFNPFENL